MYSQQPGADGAAAGGEPGATGGKGDEDVIDAEFTEA
jgi:hypothetical protein